MIVGGRQQYLFDETGRRFLDVRALTYISATVHLLAAMSA